MKRRWFLTINRRFSFVKISAGRISQKADGKQSELRGAIRVVFCLAGVEGDAIPIGGIEGRQSFIGVQGGKPCSGCKGEAPCSGYRVESPVLGAGAKRPARVEGRQPRPVK